MYKKIVSFFLLSCSPKKVTKEEKFLAFFACPKKVTKKRHPADFFNGFFLLSPEEEYAHFLDRDK